MQNNKTSSTRTCHPYDQLLVTKEVHADWGIQPRIVEQELDSTSHQNDSRRWRR